MDKRPIFLVVGLLAGTAVVAQTYRWVDEEGVVHYSDRPQEGAEIIELPEANVTNVRRYNRQAAADGGAAGQDEAQEDFSYDSLDVTSPAAEETLWNIAGTLNVTLSSSPSLRPGDQVRVYFDGQPQIVSSLSFQLDEVWRGVHNIQAEILDSGGRLMIRSQPNRFYVQQTSVRN